MTLKLDYGCSFFNSIRQTMQYSQWYGLEEHSLILDVDFAVSEARYKLLQQALVTYLNVERASSLATGPEENQSAVPCGDVIRSDWVRPIGLRHLEFHARTHATPYLCLVIKRLIYLIFWPLYDTYLLFCFVFVFSALHDFDLANIFHISNKFIFVFLISFLIYAWLEDTIKLISTPYFL